MRVSTRFLVCSSLAVLGAACGADNKAEPSVFDSADPVAGPAATVWSPEADPTVDSVAGNANVPPPLCHVVLDCPTDIPDEPKIDCDIEIAGDDEGFAGRAGVELRVDVSTSGDTQQQPVFTPEASVVRHNGHGADAAGGSRAYRRSLGMTPARMDREIDALAEQLDFGSGGEEEGKVEVGLWVARLLHRARARRCAARSGAFARRAFKGACELMCACAWV